jgi:hypothetical protein
VIGEDLQRDRINAHCVPLLPNRNVMTVTPSETVTPSAARGL